MSEWQPIETAPMDGSKVLAWDQDWQLPVVMHFTSRDYLQREYGDPDYMEEGWYADYSYPEPGFPESPMRATHWMPLPPPPTPRS